MAAANDFTPTGGSPRESDDSDSIEATIRSAVDQHDADAAEDDDKGDDTKPAPKDGKTEDGDDDKKVVVPPVDGDKKADAKDDGKRVEGDKASADKKADAKPEDKSAKADDKKADDKAGEAPASWPAEAKALFKAQPKPVQDFLLERHRSMEADYTRKTQDLAVMRKEYEGIDAIFAPQRDKLKAANLTAPQVVQGWANAELALMNGKGLDFLPGVAKAYKIDPIKLAHRILVEGGVADPETALRTIAENAAGQVKNQPQPVHLPADVLRRLERVDQVAAHVEGQQRQQAEAEVARMNTELDNFKTATDAKGALLHPFFDELVEDMSRLVDQAVAAKRTPPPIDQLYQDAIFSNPTVRQKWLDGKLAAERSTTETAQRAAAEKAAAEAKEKANKARKAGSSVTGSPGTGQPLNGRGNASDGAPLRSIISAAVDDQADTVH